MMIRPARLSAAVLLLFAALVAAEKTVLPPPPRNVVAPILTTLTHGVQLLAEGDFDFARGHFDGVHPPKPSTVFLNVSGLPQAFRRKAHQSAVEAMRAWNEAMPDLVQFVETPAEDLAQVEICFEHDVATTEGDRVKYVCGITTTHAPHDGKGIDRSSLIRVALFGEGVGKPAHSAVSLTHVVGHELGHYLGLDESADKRNVMGPDDHANAASTRPSPRDAQRLTDLVRLADQLSAVAQSGKRIPVPKEWAAVTTKPPAAQPRKQPSPAETSPKPGEKAPDFRLNGLDGKEHALSEFAGKLVLVDFWATWCGPCRADLPNLKKLVEKYVPQGLAVVGISLDNDEQKLRDFVKAESLTWLQLFDGQGWQNAVAKQYNVQAIPQALLIGKDGAIVRREYRATAFEDDLAKLLK